LPINLIKREGFVERLNQKGYTKKDAGTIMDDVFGTVAEILVEGGSVMFHGFGTFETADYAAREMTSVHGGKAVARAHRVVRFKPGKLLKRLVAGKVEVHA
jgi:DNA-binding protein HU-beta